VLTMGPVLGAARAGSITYATPLGSSTPGGAVDAEAVFTTSAGALTITLTDLQANPTNVGQLLSDLSFTASGTDALNGASLASSQGQEIAVNKGGTFSTGATVPTGWIPTLSGNSGNLDVLGGGGAGPEHLIIGPPDHSGLYSNANGSIAGNGAHDPFLNQSATFTITGPNITADTSITGASFSFGTTEGAAGYTVTGSAVPEPGSLVLALIGAGVVGSIGFQRSRRRPRLVIE